MRMMRFRELSFTPLSKLLKLSWLIHRCCAEKTSLSANSRGAAHLCENSMAATLLRLRVPCSGKTLFTEPGALYAAQSRTAVVWALWHPLYCLGFSGGSPWGWVWSLNCQLYRCSQAKASMKTHLKSWSDGQQAFKQHPRAHQVKSV